MAKFVLLLQYSEQGIRGIKDTTQRTACRDKAFTGYEVGHESTS
jgi:uncharacterized protein with GYD domain